MTLPVEEPIGGGGQNLGPDLPYNAISGVSVAKGAADGTAVLTFTVNSITGVSSIYIVRSESGTVASAARVADVARSTGLKTYTDSDASIAGKTVWYWVVVWNAAYESEDYYGGVSIALTPVAPPVPPDFFDVSHDEAVDGLISVHGVATIPDGADFRSIKVFVAGYRGVAKDIAIHEDTSKKFTFNLQATGELVSLKAVIVNSNGVYDIGDAVAKLLLLEEAATKPAKLAVIRATCFDDGVQVDVEAGGEQKISEYRLYRSGRPPLDFSNAVKIDTVKATGEQRVILFDPNGNAVDYQYYVTAVNDAGESDPTDPVYDDSTY